MATQAVVEIEMNKSYLGKPGSALDHTGGSKVPSDYFFPEYVPGCSDSDYSCVDAPGSAECDDAENDALLLNVITGRVNALQDSIIELKLHVEDRRKLHERIIHSFDALILEARNRVISIKDRRLESNNPEILRRRTMLEENINFMEQQKLAEHLLVWKDTLDLKKELKELLEEERSLSLLELIEVQDDDDK